MSISAQLGEQKVVELSAGPVAYRETGSGDPIVFVHGVFVNGDLWRDVVPALAETHRCITPDWPLGAHSLPMRPDADLSTPALARMVAEFLAELDLEQVTLVGNDTGGAMCQLVMADHRERLARVVLTSCDAFEVFPPKPFHFLRWLPQIPGASAMVANSLRLRALRRLPIAFGWVVTGELPPEISDSYTKPTLRPDIRRDGGKVCLGIKVAHTIEAAERLRNFDKPVLLAWAENDKLFPLSLAERLAEVLPDARIELIPDSRTFIGEDNPAALSAAIAKFLTEPQDAGMALPQPEPRA